MDELQLRSFLLARGLLDRASASLDGTEPGAMASVILNDVAVETGAKVTAAAYPPATFPGRGYILNPRQRDDQESRPLDPSVPYVLDQLLASARIRVGDDALRVREIGGARKLHELRNRVQHEGDPPTLDGVSTARARALAFLLWATETFFEVDFESLSRASLVQTAPVREQLERAESLASRGELDEAAKAIAIAFEFARLEFRFEQPYGERTETLRDTDVREAIREVRRGGGDKHMTGREHRKFESVFLAMARMVELLTDRVEVLLLGAQVSEYVWFRRHFPGVFRIMRGESPYGDLVAHEVPAQMTPAAYARGRDFVIDAALVWQRFPVPAPAAEEDEPLGDMSGTDV